MKFTATIILHGRAGSGPTVNLIDRSPVGPGAAITLAVAGGPANRTDWVAIAAAGGPDGTVLSWAYLSGTHTPPAAGLTTATIHMAAPASAGAYEGRLYCCDGFKVLARSTFAVAGSAPPPSPSPPPGPAPPPAPPPPISPEVVLTVTPVRSIPDTAPRGTIVATYSARMSDGSPFTGSVRFGAPYFDDGGIFALAATARQPDGSLKGNIIINLGGPGVGPNAATQTDRITLETTP